MSEKSYLILENGRVFEGRSFGATGDITGEVVFTTGVTGYLETLTDPSYYGQIIVQTFPLIGNYGVIPDDFESGGIAARGYIVREWCDTPSNFRNRGDVNALLKSNNIVGLYDIDTRELTKIIRENGVMNGRISASPDCDLNEIRKYRITEALAAVSAKEAYNVKCEKTQITTGRHHPSGVRPLQTQYVGAGSARPPVFREYNVALIDYGLKRSVLGELTSRGCDVTVYPYDTPAADILAAKPDGIMLFGGPGDPSDNPDVISEIKTLCSSGLPIFGIGLGHQLLALAHGFRTHKLKHGHRGGNQPVKDTLSGNVYITNQNHGYVVTSDSIDESVATEWFISVNDGTCEGILYKNAPAFSVQFYPESFSGPRSTAFLFEKFVGMM